MAMVCLPSTSRVVHQNKTVMGRVFYQRWRQRQPNLHHPKPPGADCVSQFGLVSLWRAFANDRTETSSPPLTTRR